MYGEADFSCMFHARRACSWAIFSETRANLGIHAFARISANRLYLKSARLHLLQHLSQPTGGTPCLKLCISSLRPLITNNRQFSPRDPRYHRRRLGSPFYAGVKADLCVWDLHVSPPLTSSAIYIPGHPVRFICVLDIVFNEDPIVRKVWKA